MTASTGFRKNGAGDAPGPEIGVIGAGGVRLFAVGFLARTGFGHLVVVDPDRIEPRTR